VLDRQGFSSVFGFMVDGWTFRNLPVESEGFRATKGVESITFKPIKDGNYEAEYKGLRFQGSLAELHVLSEPLEESYKVFNYKGKKVLDVGAWIGETACYFKLWGASKVLALEPDQRRFEMAKINASLNFPDIQIRNECFSPSILSDEYDVVNIDCEGCEYSLLQEDDALLRRCEKYVIECHPETERLARKFTGASFHTWTRGWLLYCER
jgi:hypothetical protein